MAASRSLTLVKRSVDCMVSAIELYNKPDFKYREESFSVLAINAWEMLLKAKILKDNKNDQRSIYVREYPNTKDGTKSKKWVYKENRSGNKFTIDAMNAAKKLQAKGLLDKRAIENLDLLVEIRDNAIHFMNVDDLLSLKTQELGMASIKSYMTYVYEWFSISLERYNFYLMPMSFFHGDEAQLVPLGAHEASVAGLLRLIAEKELKHPFDETSLHNVTISIEAKVVKPNKVDAQKFAISNDPNAPVVTISLEDVKKTHPLTYDELTKKLSERYIDFKLNQKYHELRQILHADRRYYLPYPLNPLNPNGAIKPFYSTSVFAEFDKNYTKKVTA